MRHVFFTLIVLFLFSSGYSQDSSSYDNKIIQKWSGWRLNGNKIFRSELKTEIYKVPEAVPFYEKHQKFNVLGVIGIGATSILTIINSKDINDFDGQRELWKPIAAAVAGNMSIFFLIKSTSDLKKAIKTRNAAY